MQKQNNKGITLIALIITIIVMLILVGVSVSVALNGGLFSTAKQAVDQTQIEKEKEQLWTAAMGAIGTDGKVDFNKLDSNLPDIFEKTGEKTYRSKISGNTYIVSDYGVITLGGETEEEPINDAVGSMDSQHTITLSSTLPEDTYTLKYEDTNGVMTDYADICSLESGEAYDDFIVQNTAPQTATKIGVYNSKGERVGSIPFASTFKPNLGNKLYSFGALSDTHIGHETSESDFQNALTYLTQTENVEFIGIAGDLTAECTDEQLATYKSIVDNYAGTTPVYAVTGNHETEANRGSDVAEIIEQYTGNPLYYSFTQGDDVFIMMGVEDEEIGTLVSREQFQWLYETLEANKDKRCFVFQHVRPNNSSGNPYNIYSFDLWGGTNQVVFESLLEHYPNITLFHGHTHLEFALQSISDAANFENASGYNSIHIPSISVPRTGNSSGSTSREELNSESEGYIVDVYENGIILRGRDFVGEKFLPIAQYYISTTLESVEANSYVDDTGTINTEIVDFNWAYGVRLDSSTGAEEANSEYTASEHITLEDSHTYWVNSNYGNGWNMDVYFYDASGTYINKTRVWSSSNPFSIAVKLNPPSGANTFRFRIWTGGDINNAVAPTFVTRR